MYCARWLTLAPERVCLRRDGKMFTPLPLLPILNPRIVLTAPAMPPASLRELPSSRGFCLSQMLKTDGDIIMTRKDLLTLAPRLARKELARHITLYLEPLQDTASSPSEKSQFYMIRASCDLCRARCEMSSISPGRLSYAFAAGLGEPFYSLCRGLATEPVGVGSAEPAGPKAATSAVGGKK